MSTGLARKSSTATEPTVATAGLRSTRSRIAPQTRDSRVARSSGRARKGTRPLFTLSASFESTAGSTVSEPTTAIATTVIVPAANEVKVAAPARNIPAIAIATVTPETSTARPEVAAAASRALSDAAPRARSSRMRRR
jgi:hypothetical protein